MKPSVVTVLVASHLTAITTATVLSPTILTDHMLKASMNPNSIVLAVCHSAFPYVSHQTFNDRLSRNAVLCDYAFIEEKSNLRHP